MYEIFSLLLVMIVGPLAHLVAGELLAELGFACILPKLRRDSEEPNVHHWLGYYVLGLLTYLSLMLVLLLAGSPLKAAALIAFAPALAKPERFRVWLRHLAPPLSFNFLLWTTASLVLGCSIFSSVEGIQTPWRNNYGDLAWHLGMITSFVFGHNFPPQNHIFAGEVLSYPFFINLWTASLWSFWPSFDSLNAIFVYQWVLIWTVVYFALRGSVYRLLPWVALLGGGFYQIVWRYLGYPLPSAFDGAGQYAHDLIDRGYPWSPFLTTIWITQRPALLGLCALLTALKYFHRGLLHTQENSVATIGDDTIDETESLSCIFLAGAIAGFSVLAHTHFFLTGVLYMSLMLAAQSVRPREAADKRALRKLGILLLAVAPAVLFLPWIIGKSNIMSVAGGWMQDTVYREKGFVAAVLDGAELWLRNDPLWLLSIVLLGFLSRNVRFVIVVFVLFVLANFFQVAMWNWDQIKIFLALFLISLSMWSAGQTIAQRRLHWILILLIIPCLFELRIAFKSYERLTVYSREDLERASSIRRITPPGAIIAAAPNHNSTITLTGRKMFYGYEGTLSSHGIDYLGRREMFMSFDRLLDCRTAEPPGPRVCPDYLFWTEFEEKYWSKKLPEGVEPTELKYLYKFRDAKG